jgi:hypothetical protein
MADDKEKHAVLEALRADGWTVTEGGGKDGDGKGGGIGFKWDDKTGKIDIGAEIYIAEKGTKKIAVEVKNYPPRGKGVMKEFQRSVGQYNQYAFYLKKNEADRTLYMAVPLETYDGFLSKPMTAEFLKQQGIKLIVYHRSDPTGNNPKAETIEKWID